MSAILEKIRAWFSGVIASVRGFYARNRTLVLSGLTVLSILLIVWARLGFTFQLSQFFASGATVSVSPSSLPAGGGDVSVSWSASGAMGCGLSWAGSASPSGSATVHITTTTTFSVICGGQGTGQLTDSKTVTVAAGTPVSTAAPTNPPTGGATLCHWQNPDDRSNPACACNAANRANMCHVCTSSWQQGNTDYSDGQWAAWDNAGLCAPSCPPDRPYVTDRNKSDGTAFAIPQACVEKPADCPDGYFAFGNNPTVCKQNAPATPVPTATPTPTPTPSRTPTPSPTPSPTATPTATPTASPTATPSNTPSPTPTPVPTQTPVPVTFTCGPASQSVLTGQAASLTVAGTGVSPYIWEAPGSNAITNSGTGTFNSSVTILYNTPGSYIVTAHDAQGQSSACRVIVQPRQTSVGTVGGVKTGPGDAVTVAFLVSAVMTLLYVSYTHTSVFRRHEIQTISDQRDPMDFRS